MVIIIPVITKKNGMGEACSTHEGTGFWWGNVRESDYLEDVDFNGRPLIKWMFNKRDVARGMD
jgi:hypothetical protein